MARRLISYSRLSARWLSPARIRDTTSSRIPTGYFFIPFFPDIIRPPNVVLFSYIRGLFVYCPFLLVLFISRRGLFVTVCVRPPPRRFYPPSPGETSSPGPCSAARTAAPPPAGTARR